MENITLLIASIRIIMKSSMDIWGKCKLSDFGYWASGGGFPREYQGHIGLKYLFCKVGDMNRPGNEIYIQSTENTIDDEIAGIINVKIHPPGTVIFPKIGGAIATNKRRILTKDSAIDNNCLGIIPNNDTDSEWLYYLLNSIDFSNYQSGTSVPALRQSVIGDIEVPSLPKYLQQQIVEFLRWLKGKSALDSWDTSPALPLELEKQKSLITRLERVNVLKDLHDQIGKQIEELVSSIVNETTIGYS